MDSIEEYKRLCRSLRDTGLDWGDRQQREKVYDKLCRVWNGMTVEEQEEIDDWLEDEQADR